MGIYAQRRESYLDISTRAIDAISVTKRMALGLHRLQSQTSYVTVRGLNSLSLISTTSSQASLRYRASNRCSNRPSTASMPGA